MSAPAPIRRWPIWLVSAGLAGLAGWLFLRGQPDGLLADDAYIHLVYALNRAKRLAGIPVEEKALLEILPRRRCFQLLGWTSFLPFSPRLSPLCRELFSLESIADSSIPALLPFRLRIH
jgi:hypothetical protein